MNAECSEVFLYVDDMTLLDAVRVEEATLHMTKATAAAHFDTLGVEEDFVELSRRAKEINMKINTGKLSYL